MVTHVSSRARTANGLRVCRTECPGCSSKFWAFSPDERCALSALARGRWALEGSLRSPTPPSDARYWLRSTNAGALGSGALLLTEAGERLRRRAIIVVSTVANSRPAMTEGRKVPFSERIGVVRRALQKDSMDDALKNSLWSVAYRMFWDELSQANVKQSLEGRLLVDIWSDHFNLTTDELSANAFGAVRQVKDRYMATGWASVYDFVEFIANSDLVVESEAFRLFLRQCCSGGNHVSARTALF